MKSEEHEGLSLHCVPWLSAERQAADTTGNLKEVDSPWLAQGAVSAGKWDECSAEVDHQFVTEAKS